jgi:fatty acid kinase
VTALEVIDGEAVRRWCRLSADALAQTRAAIDALNVFPVPDADTGTNLQLTLMSAAQAVQALPDHAGPGELWRAAAQGAMTGACGNSGIIVSQLLRGLSDVCAPADRCDGKVIADALAHAAVIARAAVSRPVEGTVLTVADAAARAAAERSREDGLSGVVTAAALGARAALARTSEQLDVLAASGVVDAGAAGLCVLLDVLAATITGAAPAAYEVPAATGRPGPGIDAPAAAGAAATGPAPTGPAPTGPAPTGPAPTGRAGAGRAGAERADPAGCEPAGSRAGYEVTYLLDADAGAVAVLRDTLDSLGNSVVIAGGERSWHVHVHLADAGAAVEAGLRAGRPSRITVTYLGAAGSAQGTASPAGRAVIAIADGDGPASLLRGAGARVIGQEGSAGPAAAVLIATARQGETEAIFLPNGPAGATLAQVAAARLRDEGLAVAVVGSRSPLQALAAMAVHDPARSFEADVAAMSRAAAEMRYGSVLRQGDSLAGLVADEVAVTGADAAQVAICVAEALMAGGGELVTLMAAGAADSPLPQAVAAHLASRWPGAEIVRYGGGPVPLLLGVE